jgi:hypothetical protein
MRNTLAISPCWSGLCIAGDCDGINHVDATGATWTERHGDQYDPETGRSTAVVANAVTVTVTLVATVTVNADDWAVTYGKEPDEVPGDVADYVLDHAEQFSLGCMDSKEVHGVVTRRAAVHQGAHTQAPA